MHVGEYILLMVSIVLGLALTEMARAIDRLLKRRNDVSFEPATLIAAAMVFYAVVANLWAQYAHYRAVETARLSEGIAMIATFLITYLMAALVLPDDWDSRMDLVDHYDRIRRPLWALFGLNAFAVFVANIVRAGAPAFQNFIGLGVGLAFATSLFLIKRRIVHIPILVVLFALQVVSLGDLTISG